MWIKSAHKNIFGRYVDKCITLWISSRVFNRFLAQNVDKLFGGKLFGQFIHI